MAELTNAAEMATAAGIDPETFREALRDSDFPWHNPPDDWTVEIDSRQHEAMRTVLLIVLLKRKSLKTKK
ncbi:hypothetical protein NKI15_06700 [Mesorhizobium sp. M0862]|uniref:hypothetical protein n=1 Tax=Mesorhizobium sp. M0862 TaxID=2957015 RepID=UPI003336B995